MNPLAGRRFDILGLGCTAVDDVLYVPTFPGADQKARVSKTSRQFGGLTGTALVAASRLGARCAFAGCLGVDSFSNHVADNFTREGVDVSLAPRSPEAAVVHSVIVVGEDTGSRNIFFHVPGVMGADPNLPDDETIHSSKVLFIDHYGMEGNLRAARAARAGGTAVVADFEDDELPLFDEVLHLVDHLILSESFALRLTRQPNAARAAESLWHPQRAAVLVTCGREGCWSVSESGGPAAVHYPAFRVKAVDTTGCGDVFHGAYASALARGASLPERIRFAAAAAALKASRPALPSLDDVHLFLVQRTNLPS
jgi:sugar/nucleoside kinase (ribokinase family)